MKGSSHDMVHSHVPKFGNWDSTDNVPYTAYFENARKEKSGVKFNPNDPEENPEAFMTCMRGGHHHIHADESPSPITDSLAHNSIPRQHTRRQAQISSSGYHNSFTSESGSEIGSTNNSMLQQSHRSTTSHKRQSLAEERSSGSFSSSIQAHNRQRNSSHNSYADIAHSRAPSIPKFGDWDERDPKSGEGFTIIFNKVKEEKQISSASLPATVPPQAGNYGNPNPNNQYKQGSSSSSMSKFCCCCRFSRGS